MRHTLLLLTALVGLALRGHAAPSPDQLYAEPAAGITPLLSLIGEARHRVDLTMYELEDPRVESALVAAHRRGVTVRVLLDRTFSGARANAAAFTDLSGHGVAVRWAPAFNSITHQKTLTVDGSVSAIMTLNFDGLYPSTRDFFVLDRNAADVAAIESVFAADWASRRVTPSKGSGDLVWSPGATATVLSLIDGARSSIALENEEMDDRPATAALCAAARRGVDVRIVMTYSSDWRTPLNELRGCGAHVRLYHGQRYYIHAKILEVDGARALISSQNLSAESLNYNRELGIVVSQRSLLSQLLADFDGDYARAAASSATPPRRGAER